MMACRATDKIDGRGGGGKQPAPGSGGGSGSGGKDDPLARAGAAAGLKRKRDGDLRLFFQSFPPQGRRWHGNPGSAEEDSVPQREEGGEGLRSGKRRRVRTPTTAAGEGANTNTGSDTEPQARRRPQPLARRSSSTLSGSSASSGGDGAAGRGDGPRCVHPLICPLPTRATTATATAASSGPTALSRSGRTLSQLSGSIPQPSTSLGRRRRREGATASPPVASEDGYPVWAHPVTQRLCEELGILPILSEPTRSDPDGATSGGAPYRSRLLSYTCAPDAAAPGPMSAPLPESAKAAARASRLDANTPVEHYTFGEGKQWDIPFLALNEGDAADMDTAIQLPMPAGHGGRGEAMAPAHGRAPASVVHQLISQMATPETNAEITGKPLGTDPLLQLSDELVLCVLRFLKQPVLSRCARVNHNWRRLALDESLWRVVKVPQATITPRVLFHILHRNPRLVRATDCKIIFPTDDEEHGLAPALLAANVLGEHTYGNLGVLDLNTCEVDDAVFACLLERCPNLRELNMGATNLGRAGVEAIAKWCPNLKALSLSMLSCLDASLLEVVCRSLTQLESLDISWTRLSQDCVAHIATHLPNILHLNLSGGKEEFNDATVALLTTSCQRLMTLDLSDSYRLTDIGAHCIVENCPHLATISLSRCHHVTVAATKALAAKPALKTLNLFGCYSNVFPHLKEVCSHLQINQSILSTVKCAEEGLYD